MTSHEDRIATHKDAAKRAIPKLTEEQLEAVWALWAYSGHGRGEEAVDAYLGTECGVDKAEREQAVKNLRKYNLTLF